jgi:hypothetical protein
MDHKTQLVGELKHGCAVRLKAVNVWLEQQAGIRRHEKKKVLVTISAVNGHSQGLL